VNAGTARRRSESSAIVIITEGFMARYILCIGAHPDDIEHSMGGTTVLFARRGDAVRIVSVTDGSKGHYKPEYIQDPDSLVSRRFGEAEAAAALIGADYASMGIPDGEVFVTPAATEEMVRLIRSFGPPGQGPDIVITNRPNDYHRDHRYTARLVLDATYMLTVPPMCPDTRHLDRMPVFAYWADDFTEEGGPFAPDVVVPIDSSIEQKIDMGCRHESQYFEWLPYNAGTLGSVPSDAAGRREFLGAKYRAQAAARRNRFAADKTVTYVEGFRISEYGRKPDAAELRQLFPITD
jgi:LmbE family N-acetylglucosaminyl deacetylase